MRPTTPDPPADPDPPDPPTGQAMIVTHSPLDSRTREEIRAVGAPSRLSRHPSAAALYPAWPAVRLRRPARGGAGNGLAGSQPLVGPWHDLGVMGREQTIPLADGPYPMARIFNHRPLDRRLLVRIVEGPVLPQELARLHTALAWNAAHTALAEEAGPVGVLCVTRPAPAVQLVLLDPREMDTLQTTLAPDLMILLLTLATTQLAAGSEEIK